MDKKEIEAISKKIAIEAHEVGKKIAKTIGEVNLLVLMEALTRMLANVARSNKNLEGVKEYFKEFISELNKILDEVEDDDAELTD